MSIKEVNELHKAGKLDQAIQIAEEDLIKDPTDQSSVNALFDVIKDYCKLLSDSGQTDQINELIDKIQILFKHYVFNPSQHEAYGWIIFRYLSIEGANLSSVQFRRLLRDYINLHNQRPSLLHSQILNQACKASDRFADFNLLSFIKLWGTNHFRNEDILPQLFKGEEIKPLIARVLRKLADITSLNVNEVMSAFALSPHIQDIQILDLLRESYFWKIHNASNKRDNSIWGIFSNYSKLFVGQPASLWHSKILESAYWKMSESESWRFYSFFLKWNPDNIREEDWQKVEKNGAVYNSLAHNVIGKFFDCLKLSFRNEDLSSVIRLFDKAIELDKNDAQLVRKKALIIFMTGNIQEADKIYKKLIHQLNEWYVWHEYARITTEPVSLKIAFLSKAILMGKKECFIGEVRLDMAEQLIYAGQPDKAALELKLYRESRTKNGWKLSHKYNILITGLEHVLPSSDNQTIYKDEARLADEFLFTSSDIKVGIVDYVNEDKKVLHIISSNSEMLFYRYETLPCKKGDCVQFNLIKKTIKGIEKQVIINLRLCEKEKIKDFFPQVKAKVNWINNDKGFFHFISDDRIEGIIHFKETDTRPIVGSFLLLHIYKKKMKDDSIAIKTLDVSLIV